MKPLHVLLVDEDEQMQATLQTILNMESFHITSAATRLKALEQLDLKKESEDPVDFIIISLDMKITSGIKLLSDLNKYGYSLPILTYATHANSVTMNELLQQGIWDFLKKPFTQAEFRESLKNIAKESLRRNQKKINPLLGLELR